MATRCSCIAPFANKQKVWQRRFFKPRNRPTWRMCDHWHHRTLNSLRRLVVNGSVSLTALTVRLRPVLVFTTGRYPGRSSVRLNIYSTKGSSASLSPPQRSLRGLTCPVASWCFALCNDTNKENGNVPPRGSFRTFLDEWGERSSISTALQCYQRSMLQSAQASKRISPN